MKPFLLIVALAGAVIITLNLINPNKLRLFTTLLHHSLDLDQLKQDYAQRNCAAFSDQEKEQGYFLALITGYCQPRPENFANRHDFLCAVGLNCSCPNGRSPKPDCWPDQAYAWSSCLDFDDQTTDYCHQTAAQTEPGPGQVAADWTCFPKHSNVNINDQIYTVTDKGTAITGRRFDIWFENCAQAFKATGIYQVKLP